jgi:hypothetical protein
MKKTKTTRKRLTLDDRLNLLSFDEMRALLAQGLSSPIKRRAERRLKEIVALGISPNELHKLIVEALDGEGPYNPHLLQIHRDQLITDLEAQATPEFDMTLLQQLTEFIRENGPKNFLKLMVVVSDAVGETDTAEGVEDLLYSY